VWISRDGCSVKAAGGWWLAAGLWLVVWGWWLPSLTFWIDVLEELNCWNKNLDVGLDASGCNLDSFLHETCLLSEFNCHLWKLIYPSYDIFLAEIWSVCRPLSQESKTITFASIGCLKLQIFNLEWTKATLVECEFWLWRLRFPCSSLFYFSWLRFSERYGC
jgi:hypothetical protein